jgi:ubiquinone/menaquinone biosynthesis C-methylase UbiE
MFAASAAWYDRFFDAKDYAGEARQVTAFIRRHRPDAVTLLDVACGTGRHLQQRRRRVHLDRTPTVRDGDEQPDPHR